MWATDGSKKDLTTRALITDATKNFFGQFFEALVIVDGGGMTIETVHQQFASNMDDKKFVADLFSGTVDMFDDGACISGQVFQH